MNWKLLLRPSLVVCALSNLIWALPAVASILLGEQFSASRTFEIVAVAWFIGLFLCGLIIPSLMVAATVEDKRFLYGFMVGCVGWTLGVLGMIPTSLFLLILWELCRRLFHLANAFDLGGQGAGILCSMIWLAGLIMSPGMGILAVVAGGVRDRRRARSGVSGAT